MGRGATEEFDFNDLTRSGLSGVLESTEAVQSAEVRRILALFALAEVALTCREGQTPPELVDALYQARSLLLVDEELLREAVALLIGQTLVSGGDELLSKHLARQEWAYHVTDKFDVFADRDNAIEHWLTQTIVRARPMLERVVDEGLGAEAFYETVSKSIAADAAQAYAIEKAEQISASGTPQRRQIASSDALFNALRETLDVGSKMTPPFVLVVNEMELAQAFLVAEGYSKSYHLDLKREVIAASVLALLWPESVRDYLKATNWHLRPNQIVHAGLRTGVDLWRDHFPEVIPSS